jgi:hypothetical protein
VDGPPTQAKFAALNMKERIPLAEPFLLRLDTSDFAYAKSICARGGITAGLKLVPLSPRHTTSLRSVHVHGWHRKFLFLLVRMLLTGKNTALMSNVPNLLIIYAHMHNYVASASFSFGVFLLYTKIILRRNVQCAVCMCMCNLQSERGAPACGSVLFLFLFLCVLYAICMPYAGRTRA